MTAEPADEAPLKLRNRALSLASKGYYVFPVLLDGIGHARSEKFVLRSWSEESTIDTATIEGWWTTWPEATPAVDCGKSGVVVVDCDVKGGANGIETWRVATGLAPTDRVPFVLTPTGGRHYLYAADPKRPVGLDNTGKVAPGVDVRGVGGLVFCYGFMPAPGDLPATPEILHERVGPPKVIKAEAPSAASVAPAPTDPSPFDTPGRVFTREQALEFAKPAVDALKAARQGEVNVALRDAALTMGHFVDVFWTAAEATTWLLKWQLKPWHNSDESGARRTIAHALADAVAPGRSGSWRAVENPDPWSATHEEGSDGGVAPAPVVDPFERAVLEGLFKERVRHEVAVRRIAETAAAPPDAYSLQNFLLIEDPDDAWRIHGLMPRDGLTLLSAPQKAGKTTLIGNLLRSLADGEDFLDCWPVDPAHRIVLIDTESGDRRLRADLRLQDIANREAITVISLRGRETSLNVADDGSRAHWTAVLHDADVVILDVVGPVVAAMAIDENSNAEVGAWWTGWRSLLAEAGVTGGLVVHHTGHNETRAVGASAWLRYPDAIWQMSRETEDPTSARYLSAYGRDGIEQPAGELIFEAATKRLRFGGQSRTVAMASRHVGALVEWLRTVGRATTGDCETYLRDAFGLDQKVARAVPRRGVTERFLSVSARQKGDPPRSTFFETSGSLGLPIAPTDGSGDPSLVETA